MCVVQSARNHLQVLPTCGFTFIFSRHKGTTCIRQTSRRVTIRQSLKLCFMSDAPQQDYIFHTPRSLFHLFKHFPNIVQIPDYPPNDPVNPQQQTSSKNNYQGHGTPLLPYQNPRKIGPVDRRNQVQNTTYRHNYQSLILKRLYSQYLIIVKRKSFKLYGNIITIFISSIRKSKWPLDLYVSILLARSLITILIIPLI